MLKKYRSRSACCMVILVLLVLLAACAAEGSQAVLDLVPLQIQLVAEYGASNVIVELQDANTLGVTIAGDDSTSPASDIGVEKAREIAQFVCKHYGSIGRIDTVEVAFEIRRDGSVLDASGRGAYAFARTELACSER